MESQTTIQFEGQVSRPVDLKSWSTKKIHSVNLWLNARSEFYSRIAEFPVSRRLVIRINLVTLCILASAIAIEQQPVVAVTAGVCAAWLVSRLNQSKKVKK